jgi:Cu/Ag efflux protein CusF
MDLNTETPTTSPTITKSPKVSAAAKKVMNTVTHENINETNMKAIDMMLEREKQHNKSEAWNKLDKTVKIQKLHAFAEKYGKDTGIPARDIKLLKMFFVDCLEKNKLQKTKDVIYEKDSREITSIPSLHFNCMTRSFTLKITDAKRVSTLKSLTPKRINEKNTAEQEPEAEQET